MFMFVLFYFYFFGSENCGLIFISELKILNTWSDNRIFFSLVNYFRHLRLHLFDLIWHKHIGTLIVGYDMIVWCVCFYVLGEIGWLVGWILGILYHIYIKRINNWSLKDLHWVTRPLASLSNECSCQKVRILIWLNYG